MSEFKNVTISVKIPKEINQKINERTIADGYGLKGKSIWLREAIEMLLRVNDFQELVFISDGYEKSDYPLSIRIPETLVQEIEKAIITVRKNYPEIEGVKSKIIRTAILQRFLRSNPTPQNGN